MTAAQKIVSPLLEIEEPGFNADEYVATPGAVSVNPRDWTVQLT
jgi:hypothetical protein